MDIPYILQMRDVVDTVRDQSDARTKITITKKSTSGDAFGVASR
ncbi:hypothetical protein DVU_1296 [Nitratidesulfovibrio vulgaris str. Hildenborough]|uniref:Uncharacterized protein n=1 Tax=Nitratidesulfovibrio vulgaris (strain ATCC 29579 / DSM 644 / CCUG 34227 / NCIMB 8303 / VKM B-1760 / Hildenborough) TaxID=882 RepID=Q72CI7_NITV2|nr:hypothetical protein DVU_1296 [Nitratidesulfovibrio vulgaris str. Hildenborough]